MKPITPEEISKIVLPDAIIEIINKLIIKNFNGESAWIEEETIISQIIDNTKYKRSEIFNKGWMNKYIIRNTYENAGWEVKYGYYSISYKFIFTKNNIFMNIFFDQYTLDELLEMIKNKYKHLELHKERVEKENEQHRNKIYEKDYVSKLREENKRLKEDYYRGFPISKEQKEAINKWADEHYKTCPYKRTGYGYRFYPTPLGVSGIVQCSCGAKFEFQEIG